MNNYRRCSPRAVGAALVRMRHACGLTQSQLADRVTETSTLVWEAGTVSRLERGLNGQSLRLLAAYCDALGTNISEVFA